MANIEIIVDRSGLTVKPNVLRVSQSSGRIGFIANTGDPEKQVITIQFKGLSPIDPAYLVNPDKGLQFAVREDAAPGTYPYAVAVLVDGKIYLDAATPSIIIDRP